MKLYTPSAINEIKKKYGFKLSKSLGQNFLTDKNIIDKIIETSSIDHETLVLEIGPGIGVLTSEAAQVAGHVLAVEIDKNLIPILEDTLAEYDNVTVINKDILKIDVNEELEKIKEAHGGKLKKVRIIGNLPYYITTPIVMKLLEDGVEAESITIMMQKEVADRIKASHGSKECGAISLVVQYYCDVKSVANVPRDVFIPPPQVDSTVLRLDIRKEKSVEVADEKIFFNCIKLGFQNRRKTLLNNLAGFCNMSKEKASETLINVGIEPKRRGETLSLEEYAELANFIKTNL